MELGELIKRLEKLPQEEKVWYDFGGFVPTDLDSYRGYYDQLALGYSDDVPYDDIPKVSELLFKCKEAIGKIYTGYKGGEFTMDEDTEVWVANYGKSHGTVIVDVVCTEYNVIIQTTNEDIERK